MLTSLFEPDEATALRCRFAQAEGFFERVAMTFSAWPLQLVPRR